MIHSNIMEEIINDKNKDIIICLLNESSAPSQTLENSIVHLHDNKELEGFEIFILDAYDNDIYTFLNNTFCFVLDCIPITIIRKNGDKKLFKGVFDIKNEIK